MPIHHTEENGGKILHIHAIGKLTKDDYDEFLPTVSALIQQHGKMRVILDLTAFQGWEPAAFWEELKFVAKNSAHLGRLAAIGTKKWHYWMTRFFSLFTSGTVRYFDQKSADEARRWLVE